MTLIGEPCRGCDLRQWHAAGDHGLHLRETPADLEAVRRGEGEAGEIEVQGRKVHYVSGRCLVVNGGL